MNGDDHTPAGAAGGTEVADDTAADGSHRRHATPPEFVLKEVRLLLDKLTTPEANASFVTSQRADPGSIENSIRPPEATWTWADNKGREQQRVSAIDIGKYGLQTDIHKLFKLTSIAPIVWQPVRDFTLATWTWRNEEVRLSQTVLEGDVGKTGYQADIDSYFRLDNVTGPVWTPVPNPNASSAPFELATGASDADSYHDFYRLQIAFEDVWAELIDERIGITAQAFYAKWDALINKGMRSDDERTEAFDDIPVENIGGYDQLENFLNDVRIILGLPTVQVSSTSANTENYESYFNSIALDIRSAQDSVDSFVSAYEIARANPNQATVLSQNINTNLVKAISDANSLLNSASDSFKQSYRQDITTIVSSLTLALKNITDLASRVTSGATHQNVITRNGAEIINIVTPIQSAETALQRIRSGFTAIPPIQTGSGRNTESDSKFPEIETLFKQLSNMLKERYRFDIFAPASINYGLLLNYRQKWVPQSYQVGDLVKTITLGAGEIRKYTTKTVVKKARNAKELDESLRSNKEDKSETQRVDAEIFNNANEKTDFKANASGSFKIGVYNIDADTHFGKDQGVESKNTKRNQRESVVKSAQEYRNQHRMEVTTDTSREDETTSYNELRNPNDELTATYLFYELQRRYLVSESLYRATPVILVANDVPAPHEIDQAWLVRYDWILKRAILDDSFLPALEYLASDYTGDEVTLNTLEMAVQHQKSVVDKLSQQVMLANQSLNAATVGLTQAEDASVNDQRNREYGKFVKSFFDPLGVSQAGTMDNGTSNRARLEFANEALERAQAKVADITSQMKTELTALQAAIDRFTAAATRHYGMLADIDRLRLHVKDNIIHYMQAIWSHEPADQRYFRLYNLDVPVFEHNTTVKAKSIDAQAERNSARKLLAAVDKMRLTVNVRFPNPTLSVKTKKLHQVASVDNLIGFKGNYMIFPLIDFDNYMTWYLIHNYINFDTAGPFLSDPDPDADIDVVTLERAMEAIQAQAPQTFADNAGKFEEVMLRLLSNEAQHMVIIPSGQLYIEALPGTHPLLEDFKLMHRALDVKKVQAEVRRAELENLRLAARLASGEYGDPDVEKKIVIERGVPVMVNSGD